MNNRPRPAENTRRVNARGVPDPTSVAAPKKRPEWWPEWLPLHGAWPEVPIEAPPKRVKFQP